MKTLVAVVVSIFALTAQAVVVEQAKKLTGAYVSEGNCLFETATVKTEKSSGMDFVVVRLANSRTNTYKSRAMNMDNLWTKVRTTRGLQRIMTQDLIRNGKLVAEEKTCLPGWVGCSEWKTAMEVSSINENSMEVVMGEETCTFTKAQ